jgi:hypothetical protein
VRAHQAVPDVVEIPPSAKRLTSSLRDIGYDFTSAIADLVDNSIAANAQAIEVSFQIVDGQPCVLVIDDGVGMTSKTLDEAMRFGTRRTYQSAELGRFGLGLKTASISQCRRVTVLSRSAVQRRRIHVRILDLDHVATVDRWEIGAMPGTAAQPQAVGPLLSRPGTVVLWEKLDRVFSYRDPRGGWARRGMARLAVDLSDHLAMVFHRYISGRVAGHAPTKITVNGEIVQAWDPFATDESETLALPERGITITTPSGPSTVTYRPYVLPHRSAFSSSAAFERLSGPSKWNRQQGFYVYRAGRLIQSGGWCGLRAIDEHTKFARASIDFEPALDDLFSVNVSKMRIALPAAVRAALEREVGLLCREALIRYRRGEIDQYGKRSGQSSPSGDLRSVGIAIAAAAMESGETAALERIVEVLDSRSPELARSLGLTLQNSFF